MKQHGDSLKFTILGGALAIAASRASGSVLKENALRNLLAVNGFLATPL
jgi:hypothetical protein